MKLIESEGSESSDD